jgi:hypothetical protein
MSSQTACLYISNITTQDSCTNAYSLSIKVVAWNMGKMSNNYVVDWSRALKISQAEHLRFRRGWWTRRSPSDVLIHNDQLTVSHWPIVSAEIRCYICREEKEACTIDICNKILMLVINQSEPDKWQIQTQYATTIMVVRNINSWPATCPPRFQSSFCCNFSLALAPWNANLLLRTTWEDKKKGTRHSRDDEQFWFQMKLPPVHGRLDWSDVHGSAGSE